MKYVLLITLTLSTLIIGRALASEVEEMPTILLSEVQLGSAESASEEFVEIANVSVRPIDLAGLQLQYRSKSGTSWSTKADLEGFLAPYGRFLLSNYIVEKSQEFSGGLSGTAGHLRLVDATGETIDLLAWGDALEPDGVSAPKHGAGKSLKRTTDEDGLFIDTNDNSSDWFVSSQPSPHFDDWPEDSEPAQSESEPDDTSGQTGGNTQNSDSANPKEAAQTADTPTAGPAQEVFPVNHSLVISEIMPDPKSPLTDAEHEFVELYNPNDFPVQLSGYQLEAGTEWRYSHTLGNYQLQPGEYLALYSADTNLTLSNSGTSVRIVGPAGKEVAQETYDKAKPGKSWSIVAGDWAWSLPTVNAPNVHEVTSTSDGSSAAATNPNQSENTDITKQNVEYTSSKSGQEGSGEVRGQLIEVEEEPATVNNWVLAGVAVLAVLYGVYEYRNELRVRIQQYRRYLAVRRENRAKS